MTTPGTRPITRALISVSDKSGVVDLARALAARGVEIVSTGGTARAIADAGIEVVPIDRITGFPEMMDGRVKTLHPKVHGGILALRDNAEHGAAMTEHGIEPIDLVCINLYPFEETVGREGETRQEAIEQIDIGGPSMVRSAAKNHEFVTVLTDSSQYGAFLSEFEANDGATGIGFRSSCAASAFARTAAYDRAIAAYLSGAGTPEDAGPERMPDSLELRYPKKSDLRYGENPHQRAAVYVNESARGPSVVTASQRHGRALSFNNLNDASAAMELVDDLSRLEPGKACAAVIKHANPCGAAIASDPATAVEAALDGDRMASFGGILCCSGTIDDRVADHLCSKEVFLEVIVAPEFTESALERLRAKSVNVRLLEAGSFGQPGDPGALRLRTIAGGALVQTPDLAPVQTEHWEHRAGPIVDDARLRDAAMMWIVSKHLSSNAIGIGARVPGVDCVRLHGAGVGQMDRVTACKLAVQKARSPGKRAIAASDAFFPFPDGPELLIQAGVTLLVHPGGSKRDDETFDLCERMGVSCFTTGTRHFRH